MFILLRELRSNRRSLLIWMLALAALNLFVISLYPTFAGDAEQMEEFMTMFPEEFMRIFGMDRLSMADAIGFYAVEAYFMVILFGSVFAAMLAATMLAKEEDEKTIEFLLAKPVTRSRVVGEKLLAIGAILLLFNLGIGLVSYISFEIWVDDFSRLELFRLLIAPLFAQLAFAGIAFLLSLFFVRKKSAYSAGIGLVIGLYFLHVVSLLAERAEFLRYLTPFWYMNASDIVAEGSLPPWRLLTLVAVAIITAGLTWYLYRRRDITI
ncbi:MAG: multidrug ABC transporter permease [Firmicutes bacterium]|nr:multidrug ABC transporter permease [Bacillota bacterium]